MEKNIEVSGKKFLPILVLLLLAFVGGWFWYFSARGIWISQAFKRNAEVYAEIGHDEYMRDSRRMNLERLAVEKGNVGVYSVLPYTRIGTDSEKAVAAIAIGTMLRQQFATTKGTDTDSVGVIDREELTAMVRELVLLRDAEDVAEEIKAGIRTDLGHVNDDELEQIIRDGVTLEAPPSDEGEHPE